ncbi:olfactory receptor 52K1-like, partial [Scomber scombrus]
LGNTIVMAVIIMDHNLRTPKYVAVFNLAFVDLFGSSALVPKVLDIFLFNHYHVPYYDCLVMVFFCYTCLSMQSLNLVILCYDRLMAITYPLHYQMRITNRFMFNLIAFAWVFAIIAVLIAVGLLTRLSYCRSVVVKSYFCDHGQIYKLACNDKTPNMVIEGLGNTIVMAVIILDHNLRTPKYVAVFNLAFVDLFGSSALVPKVLDIFLFNHYHVPYYDCLVMFFFCYTCLSMQSLNLVILCYDRLMAITYPLHYQMRITNRFMFNLIAFAWVFAIIAVLIAVGLLTRLSYCRSVVVKSYFCDHGQIYKLACNDKTPNMVIGGLFPFLLVWLPLAFIVLSYSFIGQALSKIATKNERVKAFKTCTAHLSLVALYFLPILVTFTMSSRINLNARIINLSMASVFPPMLNPIIYVLQTQEIKES